MQSDGYFDDAEQLIDDLKDIYETRFFKGNQRNDISLVTYSGPVSSWSADRNFDIQEYLPSVFSHRYYSMAYEMALMLEKPSILYFGDITLRKQRLNKIKTLFDNHRWHKIAVTQIAHHGSVHSWFQNAAAEFSHFFSVYSYGLHNSYKHPGKDVINDFQKMSHTILVNEHQEAAYFGPV